MTSIKLWCWQLLSKMENLTLCQRTLSNNEENILWGQTGQWVFTEQLTKWNRAVKLLLTLCVCVCVCLLTDRWRGLRCCRPCRVPPHRWARPTPAWPRCSPWPHTLKPLLIALSPGQEHREDLFISTTNTTKWTTLRFCFYDVLYIYHFSKVLSCLFSYAN